MRLLVDAESLTGATRLYERAGMQSFRQYDNYEKEVHTGKGLQTQAALECPGEEGANDASDYCQRSQEDV